MRESRLPQRRRGCGKPLGQIDGERNLSLGMQHASLPRSKPGKATAHGPGLSAHLARGGCAGTEHAGPKATTVKSTERALSDASPKLLPKFLAFRKAYSALIFLRDDRLALKLPINVEKGIVP
jgi:hypothetical protein